jgi:hypothetical protein
MQMYFDDLPIWGFLGKVEKNYRNDDLRYFLFTHYHFDVLYNGDRVIEVNTAADSQRTVDITDDAEITVDFSYSVKWTPTTKTVRLCLLEIAALQQTARRIRVLQRTNFIWGAVELAHAAITCSCLCLRDQSDNSLHVASCA